MRDSVIPVLSQFSRILPAGLVHGLAGQNLILPFYHTVSDFDLPHIKHLYAVKRIEEFKQDLEFLLRHYQPIDIKQFLALVEKKERPRKPSFLLSFDDGLREFHDVIAPILLEKGVPAICFLNSAFIDNQGLFFRYKASLLVDSIEKDPNLINHASDLLVEGAPRQQLLSINYSGREKLDQIAKALDYDFDSFLAARQPYLTTKQINSLISSGFHFGAHSVDHPEYRFLGLDEQIGQTVQSMDHVADKFDLDYRAFSFPFTDHGVTIEFFRKISTDQIADATFGCAGQKDDEADNNYQRIPLEFGTMRGKDILNAEMIYRLIRKVLGKNKVLRS